VPILRLVHPIIFFFAPQPPHKQCSFPLPLKPATSNFDPGTSCSFNIGIPLAEFLPRRGALGSFFRPFPSSCSAHVRATLFDLSSETNSLFSRASLSPFALSPLERCPRITSWPQLDLLVSDNIIFPLATPLLSFPSPSSRFKGFSPLKTRLFRVQRYVFRFNNQLTR